MKLLIECKADSSMPDLLGCLFCLPRCKSFLHHPQSLLLCSSLSCLVSFLRGPAPASKLITSSSLIANMLISFCMPVSAPRGFSAMMFRARRRPLRGLATANSTSIISTDLAMHSLIHLPILSTLHGQQGPVRTTRLKCSAIHPKSEDVTKQTYLAANALSLRSPAESGAGSWTPCPSGKRQVPKGLVTTCAATPAAVSCKPSTGI